MTKNENQSFFSSILCQEKKIDKPLKKSQEKDLENLQETLDSNPSEPRVI